MAYQRVPISQSDREMHRQTKHNSYRNYKQAINRTMRHHTKIALRSPFDQAHAQLAPTRRPFK